jgi:hypothetical protein
MFSLLIGGSGLWLYGLLNESHGGELLDNSEFISAYHVCHDEKLRRYTRLKRAMTRRP